MAERDRIADGLLDRCGQTYAAEAGIRLADTPGPLYQLHVLAVLLSARISAGVAVAAARELVRSRLPEPGGAGKGELAGPGRRARPRPLRRYDERTAAMLGDAAAQLSQRWHGDLRRLREAADGEPHRIADLLTGFPRIGAAGASIFLREVQETWPSVGPYPDSRVTAGARSVGLPSDREYLTGLLAGTRHPARLAAALVRVSLSRRLAAEVTAGSGS